MSIANTDYKSLTPEEVAIRQLRATEALAELTRQNTEEARKGKAAQRGDTLKELHQKQLSGRIGLFKAYASGFGGAAKVGGQLAGKKHQETLSGIFTTVGLLNSAAFSIYEAHVTLKQINNQEVSLADEIAQDQAARAAAVAEEATAAADSRPINEMAGVPGASGPPGTA